MALLRSLRSSVARRIHLSFVLAAALPLLVLAATAYQMVSHRLQQQALGDAHSLAKEMGMTVFDRLKFVTDGLAILTRRRGTTAERLPDLSGLDLQERVLGLFDVGTDGLVAGGLALSEVERNAIRQAAAGGDSDSPLLLTTGQAARQRLFLLVPAGPRPGRGRYLGAELSGLHLWDTAGVAARPERVCVLDAREAPVYCNHPDYEAWLRASQGLIDSRGRPRPLPHDSGEPALTAVWSLFLKPHYQFERWTMLVGVPQSMALASIRTFDRIFAGVAVVALLIAFLLGRRLIRSNLEPLKSLGQATEQLAAGRFWHRVGLQSGDEFQQLGEAFDSMAVQIGEQFHELEALARLDRALQGAQSMDAALGAAADGLAELIGSAPFALLCHEHWTRPGTLWCRAFTAEDVVAVELPGANGAVVDQGVGGIALDTNDRSLRAHLGLGADAAVSVLPVLRSTDASADILLQRPGPRDEAAARRVSDVLGIALGNLVKERRLFHQANHDWLTGLPNRSRLQDLFYEWTADGTRRDRVVGLLLLDLDRFKQINESMGHYMGDRLLASVGGRLSGALPNGYVVSRIAGDQFMVMLADAGLQSLLARLSDLATCLGRELDRPFALGMREIRLSATMGAAAYPRDGDSFEALLKSIDAAGFAAKASRRGGLLVFSDRMRDALAGRMEVEQALKGAVANHELVLHYQPVVDARTHRIRSAEALMRWQRPGVGLVMPEGFIEVAEHSGLIGEMGAWAISEVCRQMQAWREVGLAIETVNVNVSSVQLASEDIERQVAQALRATDLPAECLTLEVTETALIGRFEEAVERLQRLRQLGVRIMIDDFGTGYASLKYLKMLPIDGLKIDRLFVKDLPNSPPDEAIVAAVVSLARASGFKLVAEGIDSDRQAVFLRECGVPLLQGYLFGGGLPAQELQASLLQEGAAPVLGALNG